WVEVDRATGTLAYEEEDVKVTGERLVIPKDETSRAGIEDHPDPRTRGSIKRERPQGEGGPRTWGDAVLTDVSPRGRGAPPGLRGADRLSYEKGVLYGLLRRLSRLGLHEFKGSDREAIYSLERLHESASERAPRLH